ncbi:hypothetical protein F971_01515 [Acinetobacter vivianii]|uniref:Uncharacterized protein n=1 Tax=Acinetobacter vivianii TaxID=1776742 RepID=N8WB50_9GAMM|nr:hypothetical protein F971_01515 [Acinetobacter vivianii]
MGALLMIIINYIMEIEHRLQGQNRNRKDK